MSDVSVQIDRGTSDSRRPRGIVLAVCALFTLALPLVLWTAEPLGALLATVRLTRPLEVAIPAAFGPWRGRDDPLTDYERRTLEPDDALRRIYAAGPEEAATLFVTFYGNKERGLQRYFHNATICYPAAGWELVETRFEPVTLEDAAKDVPTCRYVFQRSGVKLLVLTMFRIDDEFLDESPRNKPFWMLKERLAPKLEDTPGTYTQVQIVVPVRGADVGAASALATRFFKLCGRSILSAVSTGT